jgi:polysaccharide chain length determinant protein (PEP-CTERM system associated)
VTETGARSQSGVETAWAIWSRRRRLATAAFLGPVTVALSIAAFLPPIYRSTATILVERQQVPEAFVQSTVTGAVETRLQTISQEILSRSRLEALITRFGLYGELRQRVPLEALIERLRHDIQVKLQSVQQLVRGDAAVAFTVGYQGRRPDVVALVTNTLASFYVEENLRIRERLAAGTADFLRTQLEETKRRLDEQEGRVSDFKRRHLGELPEQLAANLATLERLNAQLRLNSDNQTRSVERRATLGGAGAGVEAAESRLVRLRRELEVLRGRYTEKYPDVVSVRAEIVALEQQLATVQPDGARNGAERKPEAVPASPLRQAADDADGELRALKREEKSLRSAIAEYQQRVENAPRREQEFQELSRDYQSTKDLYGRLLKRYEEAQLAETLEQRQKSEQFRVVEPATAARQPAAPNRLGLAVAGIALSFAFAVGVALLAERADTSFHSLDELRAAVAVPVVGRLPRIVTATDRQQRQRARWIGASVALAGLLVLVGATYLLAHGNERLVWLFMTRRF